MSIVLQTSGFASQDSTGGPTAPNVGEIHLVQADDDPRRKCWRRFASGKLFKFVIIYLITSRSTWFCFVLYFSWLWKTLVFFTDHTCWPVSARFPTRAIAWSIRSELCSVQASVHHSRTRIGLPRHCTSWEQIDN